MEICKYQSPLSSTFYCKFKLDADFFSSLFIQYIWNMLDDFSFLTINTMISLTVPGIVQLVTSVLINFIYVDILLTDLWLPQLF
jgi:hypothetical protein